MSEISLPTHRGFRNIEGRTFGMLEVISFAGMLIRAKSLQPHWNCVCKCGKVAVVSAHKMLNGTKISCGCMKGAHCRTHGLRHTPEYSVWCGMIARTENAKCTRFCNHGGRGIRICERWRSNFSNFYEDMGPRPSPHYSIDRIDNNGNYEPGNCRWATATQQARNTRRNRFLTFNGQTRCVSEWSNIIGVSPDALLMRLKNGWGVERALMTPLQRRYRKS